MNKRLLHVLRIYAAFLLFGVIITAAYMRGFFIPCVFRTVTGLKCPGCGISGVFVNIFKLRFIKAFWKNPFVFCLVPPMAVIFIRRSVVYVREGRTEYSRPERAFFIAAVLLLVPYAIVRNICGF
jgi:hypothetical protein